MASPPPPRPAGIWSAREDRLDRLQEGPPGGEPFDALVVGGGITGAGIAHDLALRGLRVALVEKNDWGSGTSSASSRLIHGGLRYLEQLELGLVRDSCLERGLLLKNAAGLVWPERFLFPLHRGGPVGRARLAAGLGLYTMVSLPRALGIPRIVGKRAVEAAIPGVDATNLIGAGSYLDGATDDARLTLAVAATAQQAGVTALSRCELLGIEEGSEVTAAELTDRESGRSFEVRARELILAGGPGTHHLRERVGLSGTWVAPTRGAHILVPRERLPTDGAVIFTHPGDERVLFLIPWPRFTVIGTTDLDHADDSPIRASREEVDYLLDAANGLVPAAGLGHADVVSSWAGLRPLLAATGQNPSARSREERIERTGRITTIAGGKLTGYRSMAERLGAELTHATGRGDSRSKSPTRRTSLVGALPRRVARPSWSCLDRETRAPGEELTLQKAWRRRYAALAPSVAALCAGESGRQLLDAGTALGEVDWSVQNEDCRGAVDFFFRRTDLGHGPREGVAECQEMVLERLAELLSWTAERRQTEADELEKALGAAQAWRD